jgi:Leucine-rich repeat (LRR) protein
MRFEKIADARKDPEKVIELDLDLYSTNKKFEDNNYDTSDISDLIGDLSIYKNLEVLKLAVFPVSQKLLSSIYGNKKIKKLILHNIELEELPEGIRELSNLEELAIMYNPIITLPSWISELNKLRSISLYGCDKLTALPKEILLLRNLKELILGENYKLKELPDKIEDFLIGLDKDSQKEIKRILKKTGKSKEKNVSKNMDEYGKLFIQFENKPCIVNFNDMECNAIVFDWRNIDADEIKDFLNDELGDEMFENKGFVPFSIIAHPDLNIEFSNNLEFFEKAENREYLMINRKNGKLFQSGFGKIDISINDLNIRLK